MSSENSDCSPGLPLSVVAQLDDINRLNSILNDGAAEDCKFFFYCSQQPLINMKQVFLPLAVGTSPLPIRFFSLIDIENYSI